MEMPQKAKKLKLPYAPAIPPLGIHLKKNQITDSQQHMHSNIHSSIIYNCQDVETIQVSSNKWLDKETVVSTHINNGRLPTPKQKNDILLFAATCMHLEGIILSEISHRR